MSRRSLKGYVWLLAGVLAFYLIGFEWKSYRDQQRDWPLVTAKVVEASLSRQKSSQGMSNQGFLRVKLVYRNAAGQPIQAAKTHMGAFVSLRDRKAEDFPPGREIEVRIDPQNPHRYVPAEVTTGGIWVLAVVVALFFFINGMTLLNNSGASASPKAQDRPD